MNRSQRRQRKNIAKKKILAQKALNPEAAITLTPHQRKIAKRELINGVLRMMKK